MLNEIQAVNAEDKIKVDEKVSTNSIRFKQESLMRARENAQRILSEIEKKVEEDVQKEVPDLKIVGTRFSPVAKMASLENEIDILYGVQGPVEMVGNRAIRLIDKMIKEAKATSKEIYFSDNIKELPKTEPKTEAISVETTPQIELPPVDPSMVNVVPAPVVPAPVDVQKVFEENKEPIASSIDKAISVEKSIKDSDIENIVAEAFNETPIEEARPIVVEEKSTEEYKPTVVEEPSAVELSSEEIERIVNEKMARFADKVVRTEVPVVEKEEEEYIPMTDAEIAAARAKLELDAFDRIKEEELRKDQEVAVANEAKDLDIKENEPVMMEEPTRDEIVVVPEREEEKVEEKVVEPRSVIATEEEKDNLESYRESSIEELTELLKAESEKHEEYKKKYQDSEEELKQIKEKHAKLIESETATEQKLAELDATQERKESELRVALNKKIQSLVNKNSSIDSDIQRNAEELVSIKEEDERRNERLESLNSQASSKQEKIAQIDEMLRQYSAEEDNTIGQKTI